MDISVIITTRNRAAMLRDAIESVLGQVPSNASIELVIVDDGSTDDTPHVVASYPMAKYIRTQQGSAAGSRNVGIQQCTAEWTAFLDDDDVFLPSKFQEIERFAREQADLQFLCSAALVCDAQLRPHWIWEAPRFSSDTAINAVAKGEVSPSAVVVRRDLLDLVGGFNPSIRRCDDTDMWFRIVKSGARCGSIQAPLIKYRLPQYTGRWNMLGEREIWESFRYAMRVYRHHFSPTQSVRPSLIVRRQAYRRTRGFYASLAMRAAGEARAMGQRAMASRLRDTAWKISPLHATRLQLRLRR